MKEHTRNWSAIFSAEWPLEGERRPGSWWLPGKEKVQSCNEMELVAEDWARELLTLSNPSYQLLVTSAEGGQGECSHCSSRCWWILNNNQGLFLTLTGMNQKLWSGWPWNCLGWNWFLSAFERVQFKLFSWAVWKIQQFSYYVVTLESRRHLPILLDP